MHRWRAASAVGLLSMETEKRSPKAFYLVLSIIKTHDVIVAVSDGNNDPHPVSTNAKMGRPTNKKNFLKMLELQRLIHKTMG